MPTVKILMMNLGSYDATSEHAWLVSSGYAVFSINKKSDYAWHISQLNPEIIFINAYNCIRNGIETCIYLKSIMQKPQPVLIFYCEPVRDQLQVNILKSGINEYFIRTSSMELFREKMKSIIEKYEQKTNSISLPENDTEIRINRDQYCIFIHNKKHYLPRLQFNLLELLMSQPDRTFSYEEIEMHIFGRQLKKSNNIKVYVSKIKKITGNGYIRNIPEKGYVFKS